MGNALLGRTAVREKPEILRGQTDINGIPTVSYTIAE
jgi:hypothetical protein